MVTDWPRPRSVYEVRSFLGLANSFRRFIRSYAKIASPLTDLLNGIPSTDKTGKVLQRGKLFAEQARSVEQSFIAKWTPQCAQAFCVLNKPW